MLTAVTSFDNGMKIWSWCSDAYIRHGMKLTFPKDTDPTKTYQWRFVNAIAHKFNEWRFDDDTAKRFIDIAVNHAKECGVVRKGLAVLHQANMLNICYDKLKQEAKSNASRLGMLNEMQIWFTKQIVNQSKIETLLHRAHPQGVCNLTLWFQASKLSPLFLTLSNPCYQAIKQLATTHCDERALLPTVAELYLMRSKFLKESNNLITARKIFAQDWREQCQLRF